MKLKHLFAAAFAVVIAVAPAHAARKHTFGFTAGPNLPTGDFGDIASLGYFGGVTGTLMINDQFGVGGDVSYHSFGVNNDYEEALAVAAGESVDVSWSSIQITPHAKFFFSSSGDLRPYARLGLGIYSTKLKIEAASLGTEEDSSSDFGFDLGIGALKQAGEHMAYGAELLYHSISSDGESANFFTIGGVLQFGGN